LLCILQRDDFPERLANTSAEHGFPSPFLTCPGSQQDEWLVARKFVPPPLSPPRPNNLAYPQPPAGATSDMTFTHAQFTARGFSFSLFNMERSHTGEEIIARGWYYAVGCVAYQYGKLRLCFDVVSRGIVNRKPLKSHDPDRIND
jgi:hypothetical protein